MSNSIAQVGKPKFSVAIQSDTYKKLINSTLSDPKRISRFIASVSSAVASNPALQKCEASTILSGALLGESLNLSPSPQLGQYYLVPYDKKEKIDGKWQVVSSNAQFQLGYKGYIQLAIRSGQYTKLNVLAIKKGELISYDPLFEEIKVSLIDDEETRENAETVGYYAMFEYVNGFRKTLYWSKNKMQKHAVSYSQAYASDNKNATEYSFWSKDFDGMAFKTMLRQLISKWGIMSTEMQDAFVKDMAVVKEDGNFEYVDNSEETNVIIDTEETNEEVKKVDLSEI